MLQIKKIAKLLWDELIYGGHLLSLGAVSAIFTSAILLDIKITWDCLAVVYLGTHSIYLYDRYKELKKDRLTNPERTNHIKKYYNKIPLIIICYIAIFIGILLYFNKIHTSSLALFLLFMGLLYAVFFKKITEKIIGFKNFFVAFMWALLVVFLAIYYSYPLNLSLLLVLIFVYLRCFIGTNFYDIKDIQADKKEHLLNLSIILKPKTLIRFLNLINILSLFPIIIGVYLKLLPVFSLVLFLIIPLNFYFLKKIENAKKNIAYLSEIAIGTEKIFWSLFILLGKFLL